MDVDDVMPNDGTYFTPQEPVEQTVARKKEKARTLEALPVLKDLLVHYDTHIAELISVTTIPDEVKTDPTKHMNLCNARELAVGFMIEEKEYIEGLIDTNAANL